MREGRKPYRIVGVYDSETCNILDAEGIRAYPILHQLGLIDCQIESVTAANVEQVTDLHLYRHTIEVTDKLEEIASSVYGYVPVICCHNLSFDMWALSSWLESWDERHEVRVLAKSTVKPITFTLCDDSGNPRLVIWDTLVFSQQPLSRMGDDCGYPKANGLWDYDLIRTPDTPLTDDEMTYAAHDVYSLLAWLGWWTRRNIDDIDPSSLGLRVVTKTGVVRSRRVKRYDGVRGTGLKYNVGRYWHYHNKRQLPKSDDELYTMTASTRGGLTFCASKSASVPYDLAGSDKVIAGYDATSQHPAQMVSHRYPVDFCEATVEELSLAFELVRGVGVDYMLCHYDNPFHVAFDACYRFHNLRPKKDSVFERCGIYPLASARCAEYRHDDETDNEHSEVFRRQMYTAGYRDRVSGARYEYGKLVSADIADLYITELAAWEICQCYDFDSVEPISGYITLRFARPTDMSVISVMRFYAAKNVFKTARSVYRSSGCISKSMESDLVDNGISPAFAESMREGSLSDNEVDSMYLSLKADLNSLFGIEATNIWRGGTSLDETGIVFEAPKGVDDNPKNPKSWYQFGQRIVGWSRIAQVTIMMLSDGIADTIVNGDTDSIKFLVSEDRIEDLELELSRYSRAVDAAKESVMGRARKCYPRLYDPLEQIGWYVREFEVDRFCASWNKAYIMADMDRRDGRVHHHVTMAGVPSDYAVVTRDASGHEDVEYRGLNRIADILADDGMTFPDICNRLLGYNVTYTHQVTGLNGRKHPAWGSSYVGHVTDYRGRDTLVAEPSSLALYPMPKTVNDTGIEANRRNMEIALGNNPDLSTEGLMVWWDDGPMIERYADDEIL